MAKNSVADWDPNPNLNTDIAGTNIAENCASAGINDAIRNVMSQIATLVKDGLYPVGALYLSTLATNPATLLGFGTWTQVAQGRAIVGAGTSSTADAYTWTAKQERGLETHTLLEAELPAHTHDSGTLAADPDGEHSHSLTRRVPAESASLDASGGVAGNFALTAPVNQSMSTAPDHTHTVSGATGSTGSGTPANNLQPSIAYYVWERTA